MRAIRASVFVQILALLLCLGLTVPAMAAEMPELKVTWMNDEEEWDACPQYYFPEFDIVSYWLWRGLYCASTGEQTHDHYRVASLSCGLALFDQQVGDEWLYGYADADGNVVISPVYYDATSFVDGLAMVRDAEHKKWGVIDTAGEIIIPMEYSSIQRVSDTLFSVTRIDGYQEVFSLVDHTGREIVPQQQYHSIQPFSDGLALVRIGTTPNSYNESLYGYIDEEGRVAIPIKYRYAQEFSEGRAVVEMKGDGLYYIDTQENTINDEQYDEAQPFSNGVACVSRENAEGKMKYGLIDREGNVVLPLEYEEIIEFHEGLAAVCMCQEDGSKMYGYVDSAGNLAIPFLFDYASGFSEGMAVVVDYSEALYGKCGYIDRNGELVIPCRYDYAENFYGGLAGVYIEHESEPTEGYLLNTRGEAVFPYGGRVLTEGAILTGSTLPAGGYPSRYAYVYDSEANRYGIVHNPCWTDPLLEPEPPEAPAPQMSPAALASETEDSGAERENGGFPVLPAVLAVIVVGTAGAAVVLRKKKR